MFVDTIEAAITVASSAALVELNRAIWQGLSSGALAEDDAGRLAEAIHARQAAAKAVAAPVTGKVRPASLFPPRRPQRAPDRAVAIERRRRLAASGPLPPALAAHFTTAELACLRIVADEVRTRGSCRLYLDAIAARAGTSRTTAKNALREARLLGLVKVEERPQYGSKNLSNVVTIIDRTWLAWIERGPGIGGKKLAATDTRFSIGIGKAASPSQILDARASFERGTTTPQRRKSPV
ncbi:hypothetical protein [Methylorubrum sp. POS3]|uniref:hypothetical protein n=1 Tax=Methylorubrum sp. POS3 TaxID=2998492 RepID=UPI00372661C5